MQYLSFIITNHHRLNYFMYLNKQQELSLLVKWMMKYLNSIFRAEKLKFYLVPGKKKKIFSAPNFTFLPAGDIRGEIIYMS